MPRHEPCWSSYATVAHSPPARQWLLLQADRQLAQNTLASYGRSLEDFLCFAQRRGFLAEQAGRQQLAEYVRDLTERPPQWPDRDRSAGLSNATIQLRLTVLRLFYDHLVVEGLRAHNPVGRGSASPRSRADGCDAPLVRHYRKLPWIPSETQWQALLQATRSESLRNRLLFALAYDAALRRQELLRVETTDIDPAHRLLRIRAETTKNGQERIVPYSEATGRLYAVYLAHRRTLSRERGPLFLSESHRKACRPLTSWTWSKVVQQVAAAAEVPRFTTHTLRHLCLTDLARAGWDLHEIAAFAGHRCLASTLRYIHLSGRDLAAKLAVGMAQIHYWRAAQLAGEPS